MKYISLIITVPLTVFALLFAFSNTADVTLTLWPFAGEIVLSLYTAGLGLMALGFLCGALFVWLPAQGTSYRLWLEKRRASKLEKEVAALRGNQPHQP